MDLRYSREDEEFRAAIPAWLEVEVPAHGPPPPPDDWPARRAYDTAWQRKLYDAGLSPIQRNLIAQRILGMPKGR